MNPFDSLAAIRERPLIIERAVRSALVEALTWRLGGGAAPNRAAFCCAAVAAARQSGSHSGVTAGRRLELAAVTERTAARFYRSPLGGRLMTVPATRIVAVGACADGPDAIVRDDRGRLHLIALTKLGQPLEIAELASRIARRTPIEPADRLAPLQLHLYSLPTGDRYQSRRQPESPSTAVRHSAERARPPSIQSLPRITAGSSPSTYRKSA